MTEKRTFEQSIDTDALPTATTMSVHGDLPVAITYEPSNAADSWKAARRAVRIYRRGPRSRFYTVDVDAGRAGYTFTPLGLETVNRILDDPWCARFVAATTKRYRVSASSASKPQFGGMLDIQSAEGALAISV